jgi:hypothetical protein
MKPFSFLIAIFVALLTTGCGADNKPATSAGAKSDSTQVQSGTSAETSGIQSAPQSKESLAVAAFCPCVNSSLADMSPKVRRIVAEAGRHPQPLKVLGTELEKVTSAEEQNRLIREMERFQYDPVLQQCSENLKKQYQLDENDPATRDRLMEAAEENKECELVYALMRIALEQEKQTRQQRK